MYNSNTFKDAWDMWKKHKVEQSGYPYTPTAENMALSSLFKMSHGVEDLAIDSIMYSMENNWAKVYIKPNYNGNRQNNGSRQSATSTEGEPKPSSSKIQAYRNWGRR